MHRLNVEIKARLSNPDRVRSILQERKADFKGIDHQIDTYFNVPKGRLKLREGNIENALIHYQRSNQAGPKKSEVILYKSAPGSSLKSLLEAANGVLAIVNKQRGIYFIDNVKFHIDQVKQLGSFVEIEAIDKDGTKSEQELYEQCKYYIELFEINEEDLIEVSYSDLL